MSQIEKESLSALLDNEADELELRRCIKSCEQDEELRATWERYNLAQSLMHGAAVTVNPDLSRRIALQIQSEAPLAKRASWQQSVAKLAVAASVALVVTIAVQTSLNNDVAPALVEQSNLQIEPTPGSSLPLTPIVVEDVAFEVDPIAVQRMYDYIGTRYLDKEEPLHTEHIQDSPFFRLVNELQPKP